MSKVSFRVDGGSNCQILVREEHFIYLIRKSISCSLANGAKSKFHGIGVAVVTLNDTPVLLAPCYYSKTDDVSTLSPGALMRYSGCSRAVHSALQHLEFCKDGQSTLVPVETVGGLDYLKGSVHHFKGPLETKTGKMCFLPSNPPSSSLTQVIISNIKKITIPSLLNPQERRQRIAILNMLLLVLRPNLILNRKSAHVVEQESPEQS